jgi:methionyl aminopeptidase
MIYIKSPTEIKTMRQGGKILADLLKKLADLVKPGVSAFVLEEFAREEIARLNTSSCILKPAFLNYKNKLGKYPNILCISVNDEVVHALPLKNKIFKEGDIVGIDCGLWYNNLCVDSALTTTCGQVSQQGQRLIDVTKSALKIGIANCLPDNYIADISAAISRYVESQGFSVIQTLVGHGVGYKVHEDPQIPNFFPFDPKHPQNQGAKIKEGMTLAIEPMISLTSKQTKLGSDGFAAVTDDGSLAAHFEHTVAVTKYGALILTES